MDNILDHVVVQGQSYDIVSPTAFGDYIETIGSACIKPDGYAQGSTFLARLGNEQFYYEATAAITQGSAISEGTNCKKTTVTGREAELAEYVDSLNEALTNEAETRATLGAHNLLPNNATTQVINGVTFTVNADKSITVSTGSGGATANTQFTLSDFSLEKGSYILSGLSTTVQTISLFLTSGITAEVNYSHETASFTLAEKKSATAKIFVESGTVLTNAVTFYPMIRLASDTDPTYQPYAMTNRELTEEVAYIVDNEVSINDCSDIDQICTTLMTSSTLVGYGNVGTLNTSNLKTLLGDPNIGNYARVTARLLGKNSKLVEFVAVETSVGSKFATKYAYRYSGGSAQTAWTVISKQA